LTFGGAYAVLLYVVQGAVEQHHWLSTTQMIDGLALGENNTGTAEHGRRIRCVRRRMDTLGARNGPSSIGRHSRGTRSDLLHLPAIIHFHSAGRTAGGNDSSAAAIHRTLDRNHGGGRGRDPQSGRVFCLACVVA